jgi:hypothetical protein
VRATEKRWEASGYYGSKQRYLGTFDTKQEAALAYDRETRQCGEEKPLNFESMEGAEGAATKAQAEYAVTLGSPQAKPRPAPGYYTVCVQVRSGGQHISATVARRTTSIPSAPSRRPRLRTTEIRGSAGRRSP